MKSTAGLLVVEGGERLREADGWRSGRPLEDPEKVKRWGFVSAKPSEHLIHVRRGRVTAKSGQGSSCFKWPWDSVAIVPTSLQRLQFRADQVTGEKVGVEVVGLAVYRITDPLLAFRVLNFSYPERAQQKLEETLTAMFVGATRRIVATLNVEQCLTKRKSALAEELLREIAPVVGGEGRPEDITDRGWGIVIDTIEIQEVRILSESVFAAMQAPFRAELEQRAREARALSGQAIAARETACRRETELAELEVERELAEQRAAAARQQMEAEAHNARRQAQLEAEAERARSEDERALAERRIEHDGALAALRAQSVERQREREAQQAMRAAELAALEADAVAAAHERRARAQRMVAELEHAAATARAELARLSTQVERDQALAKAEADLQRALAAGRQAEADARLELARNLPAVARGLGEAFGQAKLTHIGAGEGPFAQLAAGLAAVLDLARGGQEAD